MVELEINGNKYTLVAWFEKCSKCGVISNNLLKDFDKKKAICMNCYQGGEQ